MKQGRKKGWEVEQCCGSGIRIRMFWGLPHPDPNPVVGDTDSTPDPSIIKQKVRKTLIPSVLWLLYEFLSLKNYVNVAFKCKKKKNSKKHWSWGIISNDSDQGVTKRCLSLLTNSALVIRVQMRGGGGGSCGVSANEYSCAHHVTWSPNKLWRSSSIFNLWQRQTKRGLLYLSWSIASKIRPRFLLWRLGTYKDRKKSKYLRFSSTVFYWQNCAFIRSPPFSSSLLIDDFAKVARPRFEPGT